MLLAPRGGQLIGPLLELNPGGLELLLVRGDLIAGGAHRIDRHLHLVAQVAYAGDDVVVLVLKGPHVLGARQQVVETVGLQQDGDEVRLVGLVDRDQPLLENLDRSAKPGLQMSELSPRRLELRLLLLKLRGDERLLVAQLRDRGGEPSELGRLMTDLGCQHAGVSLGVRKLALRFAELLLELLPDALPTASAQPHASSAPQSANVGRFDRVSSCKVERSRGPN